MENIKTNIKTLKHAAKCGCTKNNLLSIMASDLLQRRSGTTTLMFITTQEEEYELLIKITSSKVYLHNSELWTKNIKVA